MDEKQIMIDVDHVTVLFNLASEKIDNLKEYFVKLIKGEAVDAWSYTPTGPIYAADVDNYAWF